LTILANTGLIIISKVIDVTARTPTNENDGIRTSRFIYIGKPIFKGEIKNRQDEYDRKTDKVNFKAKFTGRLEQGFFAAEIIPPQPFTPDNLYLHQENNNVTSFCETTIHENVEDY
jgi:hypothetical protein